MHIEETPTEYTITYDSVGELAAHGIKHIPEELETKGYGFNQRRAWYGVRSMEEMHTLGTQGWQTEAAEALEVAERAIEQVDRDFHMPTFHPVWDVAGSEVDVARYLSREPENMIDYELVPTTRSGRVIILCASISYSSAISQDTIRSRGHVIAALAFALNTLGFATELWADMSATGRTGYVMNMRTLVKGPNDSLDPAQIMMAYAHPATLRGFALPAMYGLPKHLHTTMGVGGGHGTPRSPKEDLPDGTIYLPAVRSNEDLPDAQETLVHYMRELGIIPEN